MGTVARNAPFSTWSSPFPGQGTPTGMVKQDLIDMA